jgi:molecular chaperone DnaK
VTYSLGIDLGTTFTSAAVYEHGRTSTIDLADRASTIPSVVFLADDGSYLVGDAATRRTLMDPARAATQFKRRFGDTTPILLGGAPISADQLSTQLLRWVVEQVTQRQGGTPEHVAITHPAGWGGYKLELLDQTIRAAGLEGATTLTEPEAAVLHYAGLERIPNGAIVAVFDLGGGTFDAAVIRKTDSGTEFLGRPDGIERLGGIDFDAAIFAFVAGQVDGAVDALDVNDSTNRAALERLRAECVDAKEALSTDDVADIPVLLPNVQTTVRITRADFETAIRPALVQAIEALQRAIASAGVDVGDLDAVLLAGGSSRIPLVARMLTEELGRPVALDAHPKHVVALGAALAAGTAATVADAPGPASGPRTTPPAGIVPLSAVAGGAALIGMGDDPTAPALPIIIPQTPTNPIEVQPPPSDDATTVMPTSTASDATTALPPTTPADGVTAEMPTGLYTPASAVPPGADRPADGPSRRPLVIAGATVAFLLIGAAIAFAFAGGDGTESAGTVSTTPAVVTVTTAPPPTQPITVAPTDPPAVETTTPTSAVADTTPPEPPPYPPETRRTELTGIDLVDGDYVVTYDTINFEPLIASYHVHFHWNTFAPDSVGTASDPIGEWIVWDLDANGQKTFDQFSPATAPPGATQICAVVATETHAVDAPEWVNDTVSCIDLI